MALLVGSAVIGLYFVVVLIISYIVGKNSDCGYGRLENTFYGFVMVLAGHIFLALVVGFFFCLYNIALLLGRDILNYMK